MKGLDLEKFIIDFFHAYQCKVEKQDKGIIKVELTEELDKAIMNRPFYWHYMESTGQIGIPATLTLITDPTKRNGTGEYVDIGSPRIQQMFSLISKREKYTKLFQEIKTDINTPLYPWLLVNMKICYKGKQKKEELISLGVQLINGKVIVNMMDELEPLALKKHISDHCYTLSPIITLTSAYKRIEKIILDYVEKQPKEWARETMEIQREEIALLNQFYEDDPENAIYKKEKEELNQRFTPEISLEVVSGGIVYLRENFPEQLISSSGAT